MGVDAAELLAACSLADTSTAPDTVPVYRPGLAADARRLLTVRADAPDCAEAALALLSEHGCVILDRGCPEVACAACSAALAPFLEAVAADAWEQDALALSLRRWGLSRCPSVGAGKRNAHFCPSSPLHAALADLAAASGFEALLSRHTGGSCTLSECGVSLTRPGGGGMEFHADGCEGEATVLLSLDDVTGEQGPLALVPGSHAQYGDGAAAVEAAAVAWYAYRAGCPALLDARTQHAAADNGSGALRCVLWFIYHEAVL